MWLLGPAGFPEGSGEKKKKKRPTDRPTKIAARKNTAALERCCPPSRGMLRKSWIPVLGDAYIPGRDRSLNLTAPERRRLNEQYDYRKGLERVLVHKLKDDIARATCMLRPKRACANATLAPLRYEPEHATKEDVDQFLINFFSAHEKLVSNWKHALGEDYYKERPLETLFGEPLCSDLFHGQRKKVQDGPPRAHRLERGADSHSRCP